MAQPRFQRARAFRLVNRQTGSDMSLASASRIELATATNGPGTGGFDLTLEAQVGDVLDVCQRGLFSNSAVNAWLNVSTRVSAADVSWILGLAAVSESGWYAPSGVYAPFGASYLYTVVAGDITTAGQVTLRPYYTGSSGTAKVLYSSATTGIYQFSVKNLGPADPE